MRIRPRLSHRERNALVFGVAFMAATLFLSFVDQNSFIHTARMMIDPNYLQVNYTGTIVTPAPTSGMCRFVEYDNKTSEFRNTEIANCLRKSGPISPNSRMDALRDTFKR
jgi:hypothetical protein